MFVDAGMKFMDLSHPRSILDAGKWSMTHSPTFVNDGSTWLREPVFLCLEQL